MWIIKWYFFNGNDLLVDYYLEEKRLKRDQYLNVRVNNTGYHSPIAISENKIFFWDDKYICSYDLDSRVKLKISPSRDKKPKNLMIKDSYLYLSRNEKLEIIDLKSSDPKMISSHPFTRNVIKTDRLLTYRNIDKDHYVLVDMIRNFDINSESDLDGESRYLLFGNGKYFLSEIGGRYQLYNFVTKKFLSPSLEEPKYQHLAFITHGGNYLHIGHKWNGYHLETFVEKDDKIVKIDFDYDQIDSFYPACRFPRQFIYNEDFMITHINVKTGAKIGSTVNGLTIYDERMLKVYPLVKMTRLTSYLFKDNLISLDTLVYIVAQSEPSFSFEEVYLLVNYLLSSEIYSDKVEDFHTKLFKIFNP